MPAIYEYECAAEADDIDAHGHVNNLVYLRWMQSAAIAHSAAQGWPAERYVATGAGWVVRTHFIEYLSPAFEGDAVVVQTWVADMKRSTSLRKYKIVAATDERVLARAETNWVYVSLERGIPRRIPKELASAFVLVDDPP